MGNFEVFRKRNGSEVVTLERETLHIMDDQHRIALVETRTQGNNDPTPEQLIRYQFSNHLGSASLELDDQAQIISYEEYTPYGSTSYQALRPQLETPKRYRFTGKERDEETGLNYHGARYYAPWLGRWTSCDAVGLVDGSNLYQYTRNNPIVLQDTTGFDSRHLPATDPTNFTSDPNPNVRLDEPNELDAGPFQLTDIKLTDLSAGANLKVEVFTNPLSFGVRTASLMGGLGLSSRLALSSLGLKGGIGTYRLNLGDLKIDEGHVQADLTGRVLLNTGPLSISFLAYGHATSRLDERIYPLEWREHLQRSLGSYARSGGGLYHTTAVWTRTRVLCLESQRRGRWKGDYFFDGSHWTWQFYPWAFARNRHILSG